MASLSEQVFGDGPGAEPTAPVSSNVLHLAAARSARRTPSRSARVGAGAAAWLLAVGGVGSAAAMSGLLTAALDAILGGRDGRPSISAQGPARPGTPSTEGGGTGGTPLAEPRPDGGPDGGPDGPRHLTTTPTAEPPGTGAGPGVSLAGESTDVEIVLASFVVPDRSTPSTPSRTPATPVTPSTPTTPGTPTTPTGQQPLAPRPGSAAAKPTGNGNGNGNEKLKSHAKAHSNAKAKSHAKANAKAKAHSNGQDKAKAQGKHKANGHAKAKAHGHAYGHDKVRGYDKA